MGLNRAVTFILSVIAVVETFRAVVWPNTAKDLVVAGRAATTVATLGDEGRGLTRNPLGESNKLSVAVPAPAPAPLLKTADTVTKSELQRLTEPPPKIVHPPTNKPTRSPVTPLFDKKRSIVFVHVGKAGGVSFRKNVAAHCVESFPNASMPGRQKCMNQYPDHQKLALQTTDVVHLWRVPEDSIESATSFIISLRDPIDRIVSTYRYSHPANCRRDENLPDSYTGNHYGCWLLERNRYKEGTFGHKLFVKCFPSPNMEAFAQSVLPPYNFTLPNLSPSEQAECRQLALDTVRGKPNMGVMPHMQSNYQYYAQLTYLKYPDKELFALRTEHELDDMIHVDKLLGGSGEFKFPDSHFSHGSEYYHPSPLTTSAIHKLCCALETELWMYFGIIDKSLNLGGEEKQAANNHLRQKCGLANRMQWTRYRTHCQQQRREAELLLKQQ